MKMKILGYAGEEMSRRASRLPELVVKLEYEIRPSEKRGERLRVGGNCAR